MFLKCQSSYPKTCSKEFAALLIDNETFNTLK